MMASALIMSIVAAGILIPQILLIAFRKKLFDEPDERKIHHSTVPRLGGIAFEPVILFTIFILLVFDVHALRFQLMEELGNNVLSLSICVCSLILLYLVGIADDLIGVKYSAKFVVQIGCGLLFLFGGLYISDLHGLLFLNRLPWWVFWPLTVTLVVFIINAMNLIDGIDGLASGLSGVALGYYGCVFFEIGEYTFALVAFATLGTVIPFFYYNVFGKAEKQQKIFMGDTGSLTIGLILSFLSFRMANVDISADHTCLSRVHPFFLAFCPLLVPCMDVIRVFIHRIRMGNSPFLPDKSHIHHKLLNLGMSQHKAMISILVFSAFFIVVCLILSKIMDPTLLLICCVALYTLLNIWMSKLINKKELENK
ncbi:MAG: undecaprenyl/decaprenyl-phosphate alpha-N-acetylglucosaminyl 1-phosphate transferase [Paludibacteraceae bacterium]|nr:undecaprenyl/decaprenyl-phosphate alpha-N-acetylglucosaminyl 1-phosphate transferase [Paludibacteraceae bacterium]MBR4815330.1 undecaprenyl/decaprenyl-phosphate alpha-N-acetylglucosaminyl 1-phosphate transferase [Paludibacteraceae bacterium]